MEEQQEKRNIGEKEGCQPSRNSGQTSPKPKELRIDTVEMNPTVKNWNRLSMANDTKGSLDAEGDLGFQEIIQTEGNFIGSLPPWQAPPLPGEMIKPLCAEKFVADSKQDIEALYTKIESNIESVRKCYDSRPTNRYDDEALTWMMLLDGLFLLQFIRSRVHPLTVDMSNVLRNRQINFVVHRVQKICRVVSALMPVATSSIPNT
ncbi:hypothetical protein PVL29_018536 [Vitis rotundifolia]|uniref:Uncharacterized protein n=1 Tax=Vitis rotundifolia TaxID=103349 RepID=A0AA39DG04_VITRO|nr:hypothetical protein PVL29_018536 [Vitis rotundifolia]